MLLNKRSITPQFHYTLRRCVIFRLIDENVTQMFLVWLHQTSTSHPKKNGCGKNIHHPFHHRGFVRVVVFFGQRREIHVSWDFFGGKHREKRIESSKSLPIFPSITWAPMENSQLSNKTKMFLGAQNQPMVKFL